MKKRNEVWIAVYGYTVGSVAAAAFADPFSTFLVVIIGAAGVGLIAASAYFDQ